MKPSYAPDNTRSSIAVIALLAAGVTLVAVLLGLSTKPDVSTIGVAVTEGEFAAVVESSATEFEGTIDDETELANEADFSVPAPAPVDDEDAEAAAAEAEVDEPAATAIPIPTATAEIQAAVIPTPLSDGTETDSLDGTLAAPQIAGGTVSGSFFTRAEEDEGATVNRNEVTLTLNEDGSGNYVGFLEMVLADSTTIDLAMSGEIRWSTIDSPQVTADLNGSYVRNAPADGDDITSTTAELTISSLGSGSGSLCAPTCFGFTFPTQTGF